MSPSVDTAIEKEQVVIPVGKERLFGTIHKPISSSRGAAVLFLHGFASNRSGKYRLAYAIAEKLAQGGTTALRIDMRGCGESDGSFEEMTISSLIEDGIAALKWLSEQELVDPERLGILGRSLGAAIAVECAKRAKSLALWVPFFDAKQWVEMHALHPKGESLLIDGHEPGQAFLSEISKFSLASSLKGLQDVPILHVHAKKDQILDKRHLDNYLQARGSANELDSLVVLDEADHYFSRPQDRQLLIEETTIWFEKTL
jgi:alpha-beta hydrolase superfamily lysophospholipase